MEQEESSQSIEYEKRLSPFDQASGKLLKSGVEVFPNQNPHPLVVAINSGRLKLLRHPLSEAYLEYKWNKYISKILYGFVLFEIFTVIVLSLFLQHVWHFEYLSLFKNISREDLCLPQNLSKTNFIEEVSDKNVNALSALLFLVFTFSVLFEVILFVKMKDCLFTWAFCVRTFRLFALFLLLIPWTGCHNYPFTVKENWQWTLGVWTLLLSWFYMIHTINEIPWISLFMPITIHFIFSFLKVLFFIILLILIYAIIFFLLLPKSNAFASLHISFVKTTVWFLGDLAYDDTFLDEASPIAHPLLTNILFLLLVTSISGFIANLFISKPDDLLEYFRVRADFHKIASRTQTILKLDNLSQCLKRRNTIQRWQKQARAENNFIKVCKRFLKNLDSSYNYAKDDESSKDDALIIKLDTILEELKKQNNEQESLRQTNKNILERLENLTDEQEILKKMLQILNKTQKN